MRRRACRAETTRASVSNGVCKGPGLLTKGNTLLAIDRASREERRKAQAEGAQRLIESGMLDDLFAKIDAGEVQLDGDGGFIRQLIKTGLERGLQAELTEHVGYEKGDPEAALHDNSRNGSFPKTVGTTAGEVELRIPRDRNGTFTPRLVPTGSRRLSQLDEMIISLYAGGMTVRDIEHHLVSTLGSRPQPRDDLQHHRGDRRRGPAMAEPAVGSVLPGDLHGRPGDQGP